MINILQTPVYVNKEQRFYYFSVGLQLGYIRTLWVTLGPLGASSERAKPRNRRRPSVITRAPMMTSSFDFFLSIFKNLKTIN